MRDNLKRPCGCTSCECQPRAFWQEAIVMTVACFSGFTIAALFFWWVLLSVWPW